jgi:hypothetical protein
MCRQDGMRYVVTWRVLTAAGARTTPSCIDTLPEGPAKEEQCLVYPILPAFFSWYSQLY